MQRILYTLGICLLLFSCTSVKTYNEQIAVNHSARNLKKDVDVAYKKLKKLHPRLYQYISKKELDYKFDSLKKTIVKPLSSQQFYEKLAPVIAEVRQGHITVSPPHKRFNSKQRKLLNKNKFEFYELDFEYLNNNLWIVNTRGGDSTIIGSKAVKINDEDVSKLFNKYKRLFSSDGYNTTFQDRMVASRFSGYYYLDKGFVDSLSIVLKKEDSLFTKVLRRIPKDSIPGKIKIDSVQKTPKKLTEEQKKELKLKEKEKREKDYIYGFEKAKNRYTRNLNFIDKDSSVAIMKIRGFGNGNYKKFYQESFAKIDAAKTEYLILDLRDNTGGRLEEIDKLYSYLTDKEYQLIKKAEVLTRQPFLTSMLSKNNSVFIKISATLLSPFMAVYNLFKSGKKDGKKYYSFSSSKVKKPNPLNFKGEIYVLINGASFSASSILSTNLHANKRATFVGEETGGAYNGTVAGLFKFIELPNSKVKMNIGLAQIEAPYRLDPDGYGIKPDVEIIPTIEDRLNNVDPELEWVLEDINSKKND
ncbi:S41 family peptidase [Aureibaculum sp. 2210JD6-5]|uniref:S41 family peptidase n=1 Tax=Aureibaculum sp. 2210JD6-5 TaxID=3103957 RepID=UPI002AAF0633|nr:S41 family peptidase [Aureibaculum sp. 2210JD6-5]MDY7394836.1 S41 family peptidase [Aureibaculum sp. 2210JD6-5]